MRPLSKLLFLSAAISPALALPATNLGIKDTTHISRALLPLPSKTIFQFDQLGYWIENIAVCQNGDLLVTILDPAPLLYRISAPSSPEPVAELVYDFSEVSGLLGITETKPNTFVLAGGNFSSTGVGTPGTSSVWEVAFGPRHGSSDNHNDSAPAPAVRKITDIAPAVFLNGVETVPGRENLVLISDSTLGLVYRVDTQTGDHEVAIQVPEMAPLANASLLIGINGIKVQEGYLYFDNSFATTIYRIQITDDGFAAPGAPVETVATLDGEPFVDDFVFGPGTNDDGSQIIWATTNLGNTVRWVNVTDGNNVVVAGSPTELTVAGDTAAAFGRTDQDRDVLYVVTGGAAASPVNGTITEPGKIVAIDTAGF